MLKFFDPLFVIIFSEALKICLSFRDNLQISSQSLSSKLFFSCLEKGKNQWESEENMINKETFRNISPPA